MVDVQEQTLGRKHPNGRTIKRNLLRTLDGKFVTLVDGDAVISGMQRYEHPTKGCLGGRYVGGRRFAVSEVHRVYPSQNRIELYCSSQGDTQ